MCQLLKRAMMKVVALCMSVALMACGDSGSERPVQLGVTELASITGLAVSDNALAGANVEARCLDGSGFVNAVTTDASGRFDGEVNASALPCALRVVSTSNGQHLHSLALAKGHTNITTLTDLVLAYAANKTPSEWYQGDSNLGSALAFERAKRTLMARIAAAGFSLPSLSYEPFNQAFELGDSAGKLLDSIHNSLAASTTFSSYAELLDVIKDGNVASFPLGPLKSATSNVVKAYALANLQTEGWREDFNGAGSAQDSTDDAALSAAGPLGEPVIKLSAAPSATHIRLDTGVLNEPVLSTGNLGVWVKTADADNLMLGVFLYAREGGIYTDFINLYDGINRFYDFGDGEAWVFVKTDASKWSRSSGAQAFGQSKAITRIRFGIYPKNFPDAEVSAQFSGLYLQAKSNRPKVTLSFDDGNESDRTKAAPYLKQLNLPATTYVIRELVDNPGYLSKLQLDELRDDFGWLVSSHSKDPIRDISQTQRQTELQAVKQWMSIRGYAWQHYAYPQGRYNRVAMTQLKALGYKTARTTLDVLNSRAIEANVYSLTGWKTSTKSLAELREALDNAVAYSLDMNIYTHRLQAQSDATHTSETTWQSMMDLVASYRDQGLIDVVNVDELHAGVTRIAPKQFELGSDVLDAEPNALTVRSFTIEGVPDGELVKVRALGAASVSPALAREGDTVVVRLHAGALGATVSGGVQINGVQDDFEILTRTAN